MILSDIGMPEVDGYAFIRQVRALPPGLGAIVQVTDRVSILSSPERCRALARLWG